MFVRPHFDHVGTIHDQAYNFAFHQKLEPFQYNASVAITGTSRGTSKEKIHQELVLESVQLKEWYRELCWFVKSLNPTLNRSYKTSNFHNIPQFKVKHNFFENSCNRQESKMTFNFKFCIEISIYFCFHQDSYLLVYSHIYIRIRRLSDICVILMFHLCKVC